MAMPSRQFNFYNEQVKKRFIEVMQQRYKPNTVDLYSKCLNKLSEYERDEWKDDVYNQSERQLKDFLDYCESSAAKSGNVMMTVIRKYVQWAISEGYSKSNFDFTQMIDVNKIKTHVNINAIKTQYIKDQDELFSICMFCANAQDAVGFVLTYFGIDGEKHSEMINLARSDIKENGVTIQRNLKEFFIEIPERFLEVIRDAVDEAVYYKYNNMDNQTTKAKSYELSQTGYVLKVAKGNNNQKIDEISPQIINQRLKKIARLYDMRNLSRLNPKNVLISGMFDALRRIENDKQGELNKINYETVLEQYNISLNLWNDYKVKYDMFKEAIKEMKEMV